mmetsp:Transcript_8536/g.14672  ORF Transcript_8536/g.14672 Transcript_8536/m.14672 type:complete len:108 (+) Transcript_8536:152-475(+)|eukprot:CAMPEP_0119107242 /NCGR_PEP_ID=MMETSP1180-20130426/9592_1 /TAXON_ID=3052 ORGANISM="Chlamydomonas cf sp, Strain CCMP681" /NCGR_SAMPLE_ID=MMETSP1180 /ASSEMBLY_ACC=CAM_ASM_000741 /LENGTH=107 /DNA_ID=CAMNT_0007092703 /DNA_START=128 /DNA_END=451 /DNA_ORIENTATION=+
MAHPRVNKPIIDYIKVNRRKAQVKAKLTGKAEKGKRGKLAVSGVRTKKHAKRVAHKQRMDEMAEDKEAVAAAAEAAAPAEVKMKKGVRVKKIKVKKTKAAEPEAMQE